MRLKSSGKDGEAPPGLQVFEHFFVIETLPNFQKTF